jgi:hypothetical protein
MSNNQLLFFGVKASAICLQARTHPFSACKAGICGEGYSRRTNPPKIMQIEVEKVVAITAFWPGTYRRDLAHIALALYQRHRMSLGKNTVYSHLIEKEQHEYVNIVRALVDRLEDLTRPVYLQGQVR